jgi:hypothetical protein
MNFFKLNWAEWLCVTIVVAALAGVWLLYSDNKELSRESGSLTTENAVLEAHNQIRTESSAITDSVVTEFVKEKEIVKAELDKSRIGAINEYIDGVTTKPAIPVTETTLPSRPPEKTPSGNIDSAGRARVAVLVNRMQYHYCEALATRSDCSTNSSN